MGVSLPCDSAVSPTSCKHWGFSDFRCFVNAMDGTDGSFPNLPSSS